MPAATTIAETHPVLFVGAGPGAADLLTLGAARAIAEASRQPGSPRRCALRRTKARLASTPMYISATPYCTPG